MDDRAASSLSVPLPPVMITESGCADHRARDRTPNRTNTSQYSTKLRGTLGKSFIVFSMSVIVEQESGRFPRDGVAFTWYSSSETVLLTLMA